MIIPQNIVEKLALVAPNNEGGLLNNPDYNCLQEQLKFVYKVFTTVNPQNVLETGTFRCMFDLFVLSNFPVKKIYTCDPWPMTINAVNVMNNEFPGRIIFKNEKSSDFFNNFEKNILIDLAWVDGDHSYAGCFNDLVGCSALKIPHLIIDDYREISTVNKAVKDFLLKNEYRKVEESDSIDIRGIVRLERI